MCRRYLRLVQAAGLCLAAVFAAGCGSPEAQFHLDRLYAHKTLDAPENSEEVRALRAQLKNLAEVMEGLYGTPDAPHVPQLPDVEVSAVLDEGLIRLAAGPVGRDEFGTPRGLYREHCAHCHGVNGDGAGPTAAFLNPYPRDFRMGKFKFKSTPLGVRPTHDDLRKTLIEGIPDTAMPSFRLLADDEIDALVTYVRYLAARGETERKLIELLAGLDAGDLIIDPQLKDQDDAQFQEQVAYVREEVAAVIGPWVSAEDQVTEIPPPPEGWLAKESIAHGRNLFFGTVANCIKCHGNLALGDGETGDFDDWTKEIDEKNPAQRAPEYLALGIAEPRVISPRAIHPRNLRSGVFRGGRRPADIYLRVKNGIEGTPMPAAPSSAVFALWLPENINEHGGVIDQLFMFIMYLTGAIFVGTGFALFWFMWKYDAYQQPEPVEVHARQPHAGSGVVDHSGGDAAVHRHLPDERLGRCQDAAAELPGPDHSRNRRRRSPSRWRSDRPAVRMADSLCRRGRHRWDPDDVHTSTTCTCRSTRRS
jgi:mono/diheme cytochrome c family protein